MLVAIELPLLRRPLTHRCFEFEDEATQVRQKVSARVQVRRCFATQKGSGAAAADGAGQEDHCCRSLQAAPDGHRVRDEGVVDRSGESVTSRWNCGRGF